MTRTVELRINGHAEEVDVRPDTRLLDLIRDRLGLTGTKEACGEGECGACTVLVDGRAVNACLYPAIEIDGRDVVTIEGLATVDGRLSVLQESFVRHFGVQCGFCTPGMILAATSLLSETPEPTDQEIREALRGNLCRCTGYTQIITSIRHAIDRMRVAEGGEGGAEEAGQSVDGSAR